MAKAFAYNSTESPQSTDADGHQLAGGEWGWVEKTDQAVKDAVAAGRLVYVDEPGDQASKEAKQAYANRPAEPKKSASKSEGE